jgi:hypothetical protein
MKTDDLIDLLARSAGAAPRRLVAQRLGTAMVLGLSAGLAIAFAWLGFIPAQTFELPAPWFKLAYAAALAAAAAWLAARLARPGAPVGGAWAATAAVALAAAAVGLWAWRLTPPELRMKGLLGHSWWECPWLVLAIALPALAALLWAMRGLAPTRPRAAGFAAGLLAGALGAGAYALACTELAMSFVAAWYTLGMLVTGALGALLGPRLMRW